MNKTLATALAVSMALSASTAFAGGPIIVEEVEEVVVERPATSGILPLLIGIVVICAVLCGDDEDEPPVQTETQA